MARRRVAGEAAVRQLVPPGFEAAVPPVTGGHLAGADWEAACFRAGCAAARALAQRLLAALAAEVDAGRPAGYVAAGWRSRTLVTRMGDVRVRRRLYRAPDGTAHFLLDERLGWTPRVAATPELLAVLVEMAADVPFADTAGWLARATAGVLSGPTVRRRLGRVADRARAAEAAAQAAWTATGRLPGPPGARVVDVLYVEADSVHVKTQRAPEHRTGYELKCASVYEGWEQVGRATPGHPRPHYRLVHKQVYCHGHPTDAVPFWEGASAALARTYDLSRLPLVPVGGDGANWIDGAAAVFPHVVRSLDGFHLARDAGRGWGPETGARLYAALRTGDTAAAVALLPGPAPARRPGAVRGPPAAVARAGSPRPPPGDGRRPADGRPRLARPGAAGAGPARRSGDGDPGRHQRPPPRPPNEAPRLQLERRGGPAHGQGARTRHQRHPRRLAPRHRPHGRPRARSHHRAPPPHPARGLPTKLIQSLLRVHQELGQGC